MRKNLIWVRNSPSPSPKIQKKKKKKYSLVPISTMVLTMTTILAMATIDQLQVLSHVNMKVPQMKIYI